MSRNRGGRGLHSMLRSWRKSRYMRKRRLQYGGVYLDKRYGIWYYRRSVNGKRKLQPIGTLAEYPTKAAAKEAAKAYVDTNSKPRSPSFEFAALRYMASKRMPKHPPTAA